MFFLIYGMVFVGSALMVYNIVTYVKYLRRILAKGYWESGRGRLYFPLLLLIGFLAGYLAIGIAGKPDIIMSGILFFGSVYVTIMLYVLKDVTKRVEENEQLEAKLRAAEETSKAKTAFLSNMSHEIRTPMNAIIGLNMLAQKNPDLPEQTREQLVKMEVSSQHLMALINDILDMSRIESGTAKLKQEPFAFGDLVDQVSEIIQSQCDERGLEYICSTEPMDRIYIGDVMKLKQVLINLLGNSVKFTPEGSVGLEITSQPAGDGQEQVLFTIRDTGVGIDEEFLPHLFEPFSQEDDSATNRYGGSGLGMAITKSLIDLMDGEITAESTKGVGTTFRISVTLMIADESEEPVPNGAEGNAPNGAVKINQNPRGTEMPAVFSITGRRVLVAEDVELNAEILMDFLEAEDVETDWAKNGQAAVDMFGESEPGTYDAILMDLRMPEMDGLTATRMIRGLPREDAGKIPIIALTANAFSDDVRQCLNAGMNAHLSKPVDSDLLCEELRRLIAENTGEK